MVLLGNLRIRCQNLLNKIAYVNILLQFEKITILFLSSKEGFLYEILDLI